MVLQLLKKDELEKQPYPKFIINSHGFLKGTQIAYPISGLYVLVQMIRNKNISSIKMLPKSLKYSTLLGITISCSLA